MLKLALPLPLLFALAAGLSGCSLEPEKTTLDEDAKVGYDKTIKPAFLAFVGFDLAGIIKYTHKSLPDGIGRNEYRSVLEKSVGVVGSRTIIGYELSSPTCYESTRLTCFTAYKAVTEASNMRNFEEGYMIAISDDRGDTWGYLQGSEEKDGIISKLVPEIPSLAPSIRFAKCTAELCDWANPTAANPKATKPAEPSE